MFKKYKNLEIKKNYTYFYYYFRYLKNTKIQKLKKIMMEKKFLIHDKKVRIIRVVWKFFTTSCLKNTKIQKLRKIVFIFILFFSMFKKYKNFKTHGKEIFDR